jgi:phage shock protein C
VRRMADQTNRLYRARDDKMISGVCAGIAKRFGWDPTLVRLLWVLGTIFLAGFPGVIAYIVLIFVMPEEPV